MSEKITWEEKMTRNRQLLLMHEKLHAVQESCWGKFFRFEHTNPFIAFERKFSHRGIIRLRLDDIIYLFLLATICIVFSRLPSDTSSILAIAYNHFLFFLMAFSCVWLISPSGYRHLFFLGIAGLFPALIFLAYRKIIVFDQINTDTTLYEYGRFLTLWIVLLCLYTTYPLKEFIRNKIGSFYSYLFALSFLTLFFIWPAYSLLQQFNANKKITFAFISGNQALLIAFLIIVVFSFHLFTHHTFFEGNIKKVKQFLYYDFNKGELVRALEELEVDESWEFRHYEIYTRVMSGLVLVFTLGVQVFVLVHLTNNLDQLGNCIGLMVFGVGFLVYGSILNSLSKNRSLILFVASVISLAPACFSPFYYKLSYYQYIFLSTALPYSTIFWCVIRSLSMRRPFLKTKILVLLYIFLHIPVTFFIINSLQMFTKNASTIRTINYVIIGLASFVAVLGLASFIAWLCFSVKELPAENKMAKQTINYHYNDPTNPPYQPYKKSQSFSLAWLGSLDIRNLAQLFTCIFFIVCQLATIYVFNELNNTLQGKSFPADSTPSIIYAQFYVSLAYFVFSFAYIVLSHDSMLYYFILFLLFAAAITSIIISYTSKFALSLTFRIAGGFSLALFFLGIGLLVIKKKNQDIINFLSGVLVILIWILFIIPYGIGIPIAALYIHESMLGRFIYIVILASTFLLLLLVSATSLIFNILMNKFEIQKKIKFIMEDVQVYLGDEGIQAQDQAMHIFYEAYEHRDQKFVYFMKRGYPVRLFVEKVDKGEEKATAIVYHQEELLRQASLTHISKQDQSDSACWACLTCCCGVDDEEIQQKTVIVNQFQDQEEMDKLLPDSYLKEIFKGHRQKEKEKSGEDPSKFYSSKSVVLKKLRRQARQLGPEYSMLKMKRTAVLACHLWHDVFNFISNNDAPPQKIIYNDFKIFCESLQLKALTSNTITEVYFNFANATWRSIMALNIHDFALACEEIASLVYYQSEHNPEKILNLLIDIVYPKLSEFAEFQDAANEKRIAERLDKQRKKQMKAFQIGKNSYEIEETQYENSPFLTSYQDYMAYCQKTGEKRQKLRNKKVAFQHDKLIEPLQLQQQTRKKKQQEKQSEVTKTKSCKRLIFQKYLQIKNCCSKEQQKEVVKRKKRKPWDYLAVQSIRIMEHKESEWLSRKQERQYEFRCILNNWLIAILKLADLYTYLEITIMNPTIKWQEWRSFTFLIIEYRIQLYIALGLVLLSFSLGIKGIGYIFEDRLGLTETRVPASFPHPMFLFTFIYKLLILSLFNTIIMTLFSSFVCDWHSEASTYNLLLAGSGKGLECFTPQHNIYLLCSLVGIMMYYPMSAYTMPNFQFAEKRLDLKYKPSYLVIYFQVNFVLAAGKVILSQVSSSLTFQLLFQIINISSLTFLAISVICIKPCLISWFNVVEFLVVWIGLIWNSVGLLLFFTKNRILSIIIAAALSVASLLIAIIYIRRKYFSYARVEAESNQDDMEELEMGWKYRKEYNVDMVRFNKQKEKPVIEKDRSESRQLKTRSGSLKNMGGLQFVEIDDSNHDPN